MFIKTIGIVGAGFTGTALAATLARLSQKPIRILLFNKQDPFGQGPAYATPFLHHLLNVYAQDMSAFEDDPNHFVKWLSTYPDLYRYCDLRYPIGLQFFPRRFYFEYLQTLLKTLKASSFPIDVQFVACEVIDLIQAQGGATLIVQDHRQFKVDKVILSLGANPASSFSFPLSDEISCIHDPWDYVAHTQIPTKDTVFIVGTGLSMIDVILTLDHQKHQGPITAISRHGHLPLPHLLQGKTIPSATFLYPSRKSHSFRAFMSMMRDDCEHAIASGFAWQKVIELFRPSIPAYWQSFSIREKKQFLRHASSYWNIHRHRVPQPVLERLRLLQKNQLRILAGRVLKTQDVHCVVKHRVGQNEEKIRTNWLINCMGPSECTKIDQWPLIQSLMTRNIASLDPLKLGLAINQDSALVNADGDASPICYCLGAQTKGAYFAVNSVPEIRKTIFKLAKHLI